MLVATTTAMMTFMCPKYVPLPDVLAYIGKQKFGPDRTGKIMRAVGAEITAVLRRGGMKLDGENASALDPDISPVVDQAVSGFMQLYKSGADEACREVGDRAVKNGVAERVK